jgi:hypothetical protein
MRRAKPPIQPVIFLDDRFQLTQDARETPRVGRTPLPEMRVDLPWSGPSMPISYTDELCG